ncbi:MAG TPA: nucleoside triphosphate pyrophosphohydrolase [bacterium]|jgi:MazG family protein|nr:nucleoside triphosphate pyrophosphohydrolase [bacterium]
MPQRPPSQKHPFDRLVAVMKALRAKKGGCPWDRIQTHKSLKPYLIEEAYEVLEAIDSGDAAKLKGELGDLLLQVVFHAQIAAEKGGPDAYAVAAGVADKMTERHPHVFGTAKVRGAQDQTLKWEALKSREKGHAGRRSIVDGVPVAMPALYRARRVLSKAARANFQWNTKREAWSKFEEELLEFKEAAAGRDQAHKEEELGDLLTALVNVARYENLDPEASLHAGVKKLARRIAGVESLAAVEGRRITDLKKTDILKYWGEVKKAEKARLKKSKGNKGR